ncbi:MAG: 3-methyl-2-oxobutanoate hydroxymethyltransferase, partial [Verrucomicrobiia bacterium]
MTTDGQQPPEGFKRRVYHFRKFKEQGRRIVMVTAHDYPTALAAEAADVDAVLVGDSLGMVALGFETTLPVTMEMMLHHTAAVQRGVKNAFLIADMPFLSYQSSPAEAVRNAGRFVQEAGAEAVKLEGCRESLPAIERILAAGIPVLGHIGLLPQSVHRFGGYRVRGKTPEDAALLLEEAKLLEKAGVFAIVLEAVVPSVANQITHELNIPTIGIGSGAECDGQVLVISDIVGLTAGRPPKFAKCYA